MKRVFLGVMVCAGLLASGGTASAADAAMISQAEALTKKVVADIKAKGDAPVFEAINAKDPAYVSDKLYPLCETYDGKMLAHGANKALLTVPQLEMKDFDGKFFVKELIENARKGGGWSTPYKWVDPATKKMASKISYSYPVDDKVWCAVGIYE